MSVAFNQEI